MSNFFIYLTMFLLSISLISCSSGPTSGGYFPQGKPFNIEGTVFEYRYTKDSKYGLTIEYSNTWELEPIYSSIKILSKNVILVLETGAKFYKHYNYNTKEMKETEITKVYVPANEGENGAGRAVYVVVKKDSSHHLVTDKQNLSLFELKDLDTTDSNLLVTQTPFGDLFIRKKINDRKFYQGVSAKGELTSSTFPADKVHFMMNESTIKKVTQYLIPLLTIDESRELYWPIIFYFNNNKEYLIEKPDHIQGAYVDFNLNVYNPSYKKNLFNLPTSSVFFIVYSGQNGNSAFEKSFVMQDLGSFSEMKKVLTDKPANINGLNLISILPGKDSTGKGVVFNNTFPILKNEEGKYTIKSRFGSYNANNREFDTLDQVRNHLNERSLNINSVSTKMYADNKKEEANRRAVSDATDKRIKDWQDKLNASDLAIKQANEQAQKDEKNRAWKSVGDQIQNAGDKAKVKGDCIRKRTQTKKDYLDKKQGWYETGGC